MAAADTKMAAADTKIAVPKRVHGPLAHPRTLVLSFVADWVTFAYPTSVCVALGPANTLPRHAHWAIEFSLHTADAPAPAGPPPLVPPHEWIASGGVSLWRTGAAFPATL